MKDLLNGIVNALKKQNEYKQGSIQRLCSSDSEYCQIERSNSR
ncbi:MAG: hypothetical protein ACM3ZR_05845 [Pseudomonadota bacterium]